MSNEMNRRAWLRNSAMLTGGLTFLSGTLSSITANAAPPYLPSPRVLSDEEYEEKAVVELKARLFANENPFGPSDKAKKAIIDSLSTSYQYPFKQAKELMDKISEFEGLEKGMVALGAGSSPLLQAAAMYYMKQGGNVISGDPSYADLPEHVEDMGGKWLKIPLTKEYKLDLPAMEKAVDSNTKIVYICNPNNPTATTVDIAELKGFCERVSKKATVFVDEAYIDYMPDPKAATMIDCVKKGNNVIVARTFSKLYGFAGLRIGYIIAGAETIKNLDPYSTGIICMSAPSIHAALAAYQDKSFLDGALQKTMASKNYLYDVLKKEGYEYVPSDANFVMFPLKMEGKRFTDEMMKRGVGLRNWKMAGKDWCRISIGRMDEMEAFATAFKEIS